MNLENLSKQVHRELTPEEVKAFEPINEEIEPVSPMSKEQNESLKQWFIANEDMLKQSLPGLHYELNKLFQETDV